MHEIEELVRRAEGLAVKVPHVAELAAIVSQAGEWAGRAQIALAIHPGCACLSWPWRGCG